MELEFRREDSKLTNMFSEEDPMAWTVDPDLVTFSQFRVSLRRPFSRSRIWRPEKSLAPAATSVGESARRESTAVKWVRTVDLRRRDQSKEVILLPWAT